MSPIPFKVLVNWILKEKDSNNTIFGVRKGFYKTKNKELKLFNENIETPFGPAAGPHTQLAQNIIAAYYTGSRFFELKTVQTLDGEDLPVEKPCINAEDECYNVEWSTELRVQQAFNEYVKAWFILKVISKEFDLGSDSGFMFNMSVGYDLDGIKSHKIDKFIDSLKDASSTRAWKGCKYYLLNNLDMFKKVDKEFIEGISPNICSSITLSTLHGCPPQEIERIASYLINEKKLNTFIKCNPTLLGYDFARTTMDEMGYDYLVFDDHHFKNDLQFEDAVPMISRLMKLAEGNKLEFGVKLTNTFPVKITRKQLPGEEMYMSGRALYPLTISLAAKLASAFNGKLRISYSGGADTFNIDKIFNTGIWPITLATTLLKPGGYERGIQIAKVLENQGYKEFHGVDYKALEQLAKEAVEDKHHIKPFKPLNSRKLVKKVPLINCFIEPCQEGCPINQDIATYIHLVGEKRYLEALRIIVDKNPLPFITGTICGHKCRSKCTRNFYEEAVKIRDVKLRAAKKGLNELLKEIKPSIPKGEKVAVIGGGPAGLAVSYFLARGGVQTTIFEKKESLGGILQYVVPEFRVPRAHVHNDIKLIEKMGVEFKLGVEETSIEKLKSSGYKYVVVATGAWKQGNISLVKGQAINAIEFLGRFVKEKGNFNIGKNIAVIGGGNTAMDSARAAKRVTGVENVYLIYRRTKKYMPADEEEIMLAMEEGVEIKELLDPVSLDNRILTCNKVILGEEDSSGRRKPINTDEIVTIDIDTVIAAVGEKVDLDFFKSNGIDVNEKGFAKINSISEETNIENVFVIGDALNGPATVVEAIRDARICADSILGKEDVVNIKIDMNVEVGDLKLNESKEDYKQAVNLALSKHGVDKIKLIQKRGVLTRSNEPCNEGERCLQCSNICECCVEVCPNRANISITVEGLAMAQIIHVDGMCNECGNCETFCPYDSKPYKDKLTLFNNKKQFEESKNQGFYLLDDENKIFRVRIDNVITDISLKDDNVILKDIKEIIKAVYTNYKYLLY